MRKEQNKSGAIIGTGIKHFRCKHESTKQISNRGKTYESPFIVNISIYRTPEAKLFHVQRNKPYLEKNQKKKKSCVYTQDSSCRKLLERINGNHN